MKRPIIELATNQNERMIIIAGALAVLLMFLLTANSYLSLPEKIPVHFGLSGKADAYGPKSMLWGLPILAAFLFIVMTILSRIPHTFNYPVKITERNAKFQYRLARNFMRLMALALVILMLVIEWNIILVANGKAEHLDPLAMLLAFLLLFVPIIFYFRMSKEMS